MVVGAGPTGVEMAGQIAEIARDTRKDFRNIDTANTQVLLVEAGDRVLAAFPPSLSKKAEKSLRGLGVTPRLNAAVTDITADGVTIGEEQLSSATVIWAAGVLAAGVSSALAEASGAETDKVGRLLVEPDLSVPGHPEVLAIGDMVQVRGSDPLPGVAPVAMQMGRYAAKLIKGRLREKAVEPVQVQGQGQPGHDRASARRRRAAAADPRRRVHRLGAVARHPPLLPGRLPEPPAGLHPLGLQLPHPRPRDPADHRRE